MNSTPKTQRYLRFFSPGSFMAETWDRDVDAFDPESVEWPDNAYAFQQYERIDLVDSEGNVYEGKENRVGPLYYHPDSRVETLAEVRLNPKGRRTLIANMEGNNWPEIVWSRWGNWPQPYEAGRMQILKGRA